MICPFCQQINSGGVTRCVFCANQLSGSEDVTDNGRPAYNLGLPGEPRLSFLPNSDLPPPPREVRLPTNSMSWKFIVWGLVLLCFLIGRWLGC